MKKNSSDLSVRRIVVTAMLGALASILMFFSISVPLMPSFIKLDFSELPALIASFAIGPLWGAAVCLIKNAVNVFFSTTAGIGELSNFLLGCLFVVPAGWIYKKHSTRSFAFLGSLIGAISMALCSILTNYYIVYPIYAQVIPIETILNAYRAILPSIDTLWKALWIFNVPFTFMKAMCSVVICLVIYKLIAPVLRGKRA